MKILVTGGNGFIGQHIIAELSKQNIGVVSYDLVPPRSQLPNVSYVIGTVLDEFALSNALKGCDGIFHLAAILGVKRADTNLLHCLTVNIEGTLTVLRAAVYSGVKRVLLTSSSEVFGDISNGKIGESSPFNPKSGYAVSKLAAEQYAYGFAREYGLDCTIVRYFNIYGPGQVAEFVVPRFVKMALEGTPPTIYGDGNQIRSFCHISDATRGTIDLFFNENSLNQQFHIGNDQEPCTVAGLANMVVELIGTELSPVFIPFKDSDRNPGREIYHRVPDISKIRSVINYEPKINLNDGLRTIIANGDIPTTWTLQ